MKKIVFEKNLKIIHIFRINNDVITSSSKCNKRFTLSYPIHSRYERVYTFLTALFVLLIIIGNFIYQKFAYVPFGFHTFEISCGVLTYPITFLITDLIAEFYGKKRARFTVKVGIVVSIIVVGILYIITSLEPTPWCLKINDEFNHVFGFFGKAFGCSMVATYCSQWLDVFIYLGIKQITNGKLLAFRNFFSTSISLFVDTFIVLSLMTLLKIIPVSQYPSLIFQSYSFKLLFAILAVPVFYMIVKVLKIYLEPEHLNSTH